MASEVFDSVFIVNASVFFNLIPGTKSVFYNKDWFFISVVHLDEGISQSNRICLPSPLTGLKVRVLYAEYCIARGSGRVRGNRFRHTHVVAEAYIIAGVLFNYLKVARLHGYLNVSLLQITKDHFRILTEYKNICVAQILKVSLLGCQCIHGLTGIRITGKLCEHASHHRTRHHFMKHLRCQR